MKQKALISDSWAGKWCISPVYLWFSFFNTFSFKCVSFCAVFLSSPLSDQNIPQATKPLRNIELLSATARRFWKLHRKRRAHQGVERQHRGESNRPRKQIRLHKLHIGNREKSWSQANGMMAAFAVARLSALCLLQQHKDVPLSRREYQTGASGCSGVPPHKHPRSDPPLVEPQFALTLNPCYILPQGDRKPDTGGEVWSRRTLMVTQRTTCKLNRESPRWPD